MAVMGMTGFGRAEGASDWGRWTWEIRSVNGKGLDVRMNTPSGLEDLDFEARKLVKTRFARGNMQAQLQYERDTTDSAISIDTRALNLLARKGRTMARVTGGAIPGLADFIGVKGVTSSNSGSSSASKEMITDMLAGLDKALTALSNARAEEGKALEEVLNGLLDTMDQLTKDAEGAATDQPALVRDRFVARIEGLKGDGEGLTEDRIAQEAAIFAAKADVREELDRLAAHIASGRELLATKGPKGRKLDFLSQELNREANTLCSKSASLELTNIGLALKSAIDQFKEQVQNVE